MEELIEKERKILTNELDNELIKIDREKFFKQFIHPSSKTSIISSEDFINLEKEESTMPQMTNEQIVDLVKKKEDLEEEIEEEKNDCEEQLKVITTK